MDIDSLKNDDVICEAHFNDSMFSITVNKRLCPWALPSAKVVDVDLDASKISTEMLASSPKSCEILVKSETNPISLQIEKVYERYGYKCDICNEQFFTRIDRNEHINNHFRLCECYNCGQKFLGDRRLRHHTQTRQCTGIRKQLMATANGVTIYECYICHKSNILSLRSLKVHINRLHSIEAKPKKQQYSCTICHRWFANIYIMRNHMTEIHTKANQFQCTTCKKQFNRMSNLKLHRLIHENKMPCKCQFCGKSFRTMSGINLHVRTHTGEKPHKCDICNEKAYSYNTDLKRHKRSAHGIIDKMFSCKLCEKIFYEPKFLRRHMEKIHSAM